MKQLFSSLDRFCVRPLIYRILRFTAYSFCAAYLAAFLLKDRRINVKSAVFSLCAMLFLLQAVLAYLRFDGMMTPKRLHLRLPRRARPVFFYGDMNDHIDDIPTKTSDLEPEQENACVFVCGIACALICAAASFLP